MRRYFFFGNENDDEMPAFAVIKRMEHSRVNRSFPGSEQSLSKKVRLRTDEEKRIASL